MAGIGIIEKWGQIGHRQSNAFKMEDDMDISITNITVQHLLAVAAILAVILGTGLRLKHWAIKVKAGKTFEMKATGCEIEASDLHCEIEPP